MTDKTTRATELVALVAAVVAATAAGAGAGAGYYRDRTNTHPHLCSQTH